MSPVLWHTEHFTIRSYSALMSLAAVVAVVSLAVRSRQRPIDPRALAMAIGAAVLAGWIGGRLLPAMVREGWGLLRAEQLLPHKRVGFSLTAFLLVACPVGLTCLLPRRREWLVYLDVVAPSLPLGLAIAKVGCLLAGCCAGKECFGRAALRYPYGSVVYVRQQEQGVLRVPRELRIDEPDGQSRMVSAAALRRASEGDPPEWLPAHAAAHHLTVSALQQIAAKARSAPVHAVPVWYMIGGGMLWLLSERVFRTQVRAGVTLGVVLAGYAVLRLALDTFVAGARPVAGLTSAQLVAIPAGVIGALLLLRRGGRALNAE